MLYDYTFFEFGLEREAIVASRLKYKINDDEEFKIFIDRLKELDPYSYLTFDF
jgi:hypothetical protein